MGMRLVWLLWTTLHTALDAILTEIGQDPFVITRSVRFTLRLYVARRTVRRSEESNEIDVLAVARD